MIGDIVRRAHEVVEGEDQRPMPRRNEERRHRKVLVPVCLAGSQIARGGHGKNSYQVEGATADKCPPLCSSKGIVRFHIGEDAAKTNAMWGNDEPLASRWTSAAFNHREWWIFLLVVVLENLIADLADLGAVLLQAGQNGEIALIHY